MKKINTDLILKLLIAMSFLFAAHLLSAQGEFKLNQNLIGKHPRILFSQDEADARGKLVREQMPDEWEAFMSSCHATEYPPEKMHGQRTWWYFSRIGIGVALSREKSLIEKGKNWLNEMVSEKWEFLAGETVGLEGAHQLAGFALLYDCLYNDLSIKEREVIESLLIKRLKSLKDEGYDIDDYWTNDYQNNHNHFRSAAGLFCSVILIDKYENEIKPYADHIYKVWNRIRYMTPHDGSNHEGMLYVNYGANLLFPGIYALRHCTDLDLTSSEHYRNAGYFALYHVTPGMKSGFGFGDSGNIATSLGGDYVFQIATITQDPYIQNLAIGLREKHSSEFFLRQWFILYYDPDLKPKSFDDLPLYRYFDDIGIVIVRSSWDDDATAAAFKCGPYGGKLLNETRGDEEYSFGTDYINVAHDDPDAGTFSLFVNGSFITEGDGYERSKKSIFQHSSFIVDNSEPYGGGSGWTQPVDLNKNAWQKDFAATLNNVVFTGDMTGIYPNMERLERTFVSRNANYFVIYDAARSETSERSYQWQLQSKGNLTFLDDNIYNINKGSGIAKFELLAPQKAEWEKTSNKIGNILKATYTNQQNNDFLVFINPGPDERELNYKSFNSDNVLGVQVYFDGLDEYTLFNKSENSEVKIEGFIFKANTLLTSLSDNRLVTTTLVNGNQLSIHGTEYFSADDKLNFGIEYLSEKKTKAIYHFSPSSSSQHGQPLKIQLGGLLSNQSYFCFENEESSQQKLTSNANGAIIIEINPVEIQTYSVNIEDVLPEFVEAPVIDKIENQLISYDETLIIDLKVINRSGSELSFSVDGASAFMSLNDNGDGTGKLSFNPDEVDKGEYNIIVKVEDADGNSDEKSFSIEVLEPDKGGPVISNAEDFIMDEGEKEQLIIHANDPDGDPIYFYSEYDADFIEFTDNGDGSCIFDINPGGTHSGVYVIKLSATARRVETTEVITITINNTMDEVVNLALGKSFTISSEPQADNSGANINDGNADGLSRWSAENFPQWVEIDLGADYDISRIDVYPFKERAYQYMVEVKEEGGNYSVIVDRTNNPKEGIVYKDEVSVIGRYVKLTVTGAANYTGPWCSINEIMVFGSTPGNDTATTILETKHLKNSVVINGKGFISSFNDFDASKGLFVKVMDIQGRLIYSKYFHETGKNREVDLYFDENFNKGVYFIVITNGTMTQTNKCYINKY